MARRLSEPNGYGGTTDHDEEIRRLRTIESRTAGPERLNIRLAAELLEAHDQTGISLDDWPTARRFVESYTDSPVMPNLV